MAVAGELIDSRPLLSGWWRRVGASLVDFLIVAVPLGVLALLTHGYHVTHNHQTGRLVFHQNVPFMVEGAALRAAYEAVTLCRRGRHNGQTPGAQLLGISVVRDSGAPFGPTTFVVRQLICQTLPVYVESLFPGGFVLLLLLTLDYLWPLWDPENRALHDMVARTHVLRIG